MALKKRTHHRPSMVIPLILAALPAFATAQTGTGYQSGTGSQTGASTQMGANQTGANTQMGQDTRQQMGTGTRQQMGNGTQSGSSMQYGSAQAGSNMQSGSTQAGTNMQSGSTQAGTGMQSGSAQAGTTNRAVDPETGVLIVVPETDRARTTTNQTDATRTGAYNNEMVTPRATTPQAVTPQAGTANRTVDPQTGALIVVPEAERQLGRTEAGAETGVGAREPERDRGSLNDPGDRREERVDAMQRINNAIPILRRMQQDPPMPRLMSQARGILILPTYGRAALGIGATGGAGVLMTRGANDTWNGPAFYNIGGISVGLQAGAHSGNVAMLLMNDKAVRSFAQRNNFTLSADAGLTVVDYTKLAQGTVGTGDIVIWTDTRGLFANVATIAVSDIRYNPEETNAFYGRTGLTADQIIGGMVKAPAGADPLKQAVKTALGSK